MCHDHCVSGSEILPENMLDQALSKLRTLLGAGWDVVELPPADDSRPDEDSAFDARVQVSPPDRQSPYTELLISLNDQISPRDVATGIGRVANALRQAQSRQTVFVVAPWLSPRTRQALQDRDIGYLDLTGNASLSITFPSIRLYTEGASRAPKTSHSSASKRNVTLSGPRAGRIVRFLTDFAPPYRANEIAHTAAVSPTWVSRLLGQLEDELLIRRDSHGITEVNWPELLRARGHSYELIKHNPAVGMVAPNGIQAVLDTLRVLPPPNYGKPRIAVTGPYASRAFAPVAAGGQLMLYVDPQPPETWGDELGLLRVEEGAEVLLLQAHDDVVFERTRLVDGIAHVALSQLVLDGLAGPGRMPAEAEAVLKAMITGETAWRLPWPPSAV